MITVIIEKFYQKILVGIIQFQLIIVLVYIYSLVLVFS
jgi:hypothetical protein